MKPKLSTPRPDASVASNETTLAEVRHHLRSICVKAEFELTSFILRQPSLSSEYAQVFLRDFLFSASERFVDRVGPGDAEEVFAALVRGTLFDTAPVIEHNARERVAGRRTDK